MTPERWQSVKDIFQAALERPAAAQPAYLDSACGDDEAMKLEVQSLLAAYSEADSLIEHAAGSLPRDLLHTGALSPVFPAFAPASPEAAAGLRVGAYRLVREIGHGGMGTVYLAARADEAFQKQVAIKIVGRGGPSDAIVRRFQSERQILAGLDHPNIARLLDGGTTDDGLPYFVMEYVEGQSITDYCDGRALKTADRLQLFRDVCGAVQFAHRNHVVHRDIKPSNILVTADGVTKLLDFGIAKILDPARPAGEETQPTLRLLTPDYASPEQVQGDAITVASDVYSLGVLLYELLTGHRPYRVERRRPTELARAICEEQPERPSTAISRIEEVEVYSADGPGLVTLTPEVVSATRDGRPDKLRRRLAGDLDTIVLMALRKEPARRYQSVEALSNDIGRHLEGLSVSARQDSALYRSRKFVRRHPVGAMSTALLGVLLAVVGLVLGGTIGVNGLAARGGPVSRQAVPFGKRDWLAIADFDDYTGESLFKSSLNTALALSLDQSTHVNVFPRRDVESSLRRMMKPDTTPVDAQVAREIAVREGLRLVLAPTISNVGGVYLLSATLIDPATGASLKSASARAGSRQEILGALDELSRKVREDLGEVWSDIAEAGKPLAQSTTASLAALKLYSVAQEKARASRFDEAKVLYENALQVDPAFTAARASLGMVEFELFDPAKGKAILSEAMRGAANLTDKEQFKMRAFYASAVERDLPKAVDDWRALLALYPDEAASHNNLGRVYLAMKRYEDAAVSFLEAIRLDPYLIPSYVNLATIYIEHQGKPAAAVEICKKLLARDDRSAWGYGLLGQASLGAGQLAESKQAYERALAIGPVHPSILGGLGVTLRLLGDYGDALRVFLRTAEVDSSAISAHYEAGVVCQLMHDEKAAREHFERFRRATERQLARNPKNAQSCYDLAVTWVRLGNPARGLSFARQAERLDPNDHVDKARFLSVQGRPLEALDALDLAVKDGFRNTTTLKADPDLAPLASQPRFQELLR